MWETTYRALEQFEWVILKNEFGEEEKYYYSDGTKETPRTELCKEKGEKSYKISKNGPSVNSAIGFFKDAECTKIETVLAKDVSSSSNSEYFNKIFSVKKNEHIIIKVLAWNVLCNYIDDGKWGCFGYALEWLKKENQYRNDPQVEVPSEASTREQRASMVKSVMSAQKKSTALDRHVRIFKSIKEQDADILCLTENNFHPLDQQSYNNITLKHKENFFTTHPIFNGDEYDFVTFYPPKGAFFQGRTVAFKKDRFEKLKHSFLADRALLVQLKEKTSQKELYVIVVHLSGGNDSQDQRITQLTNILNKSGVGAEHNVIICGDFNSGYHNQTTSSEKISKDEQERITTLTTHKNLISNLLLRFNRTSIMKRQENELMSDHLFSSGVEINHSFIPERNEDYTPGTVHFPSDHPLLVAELKF